jgi:hypothetical protein
VIHIVTVIERMDMLPSVLYAAFLRPVTSIRTTLGDIDTRPAEA